MAMDGAAVLFNVDPAEADAAKILHMWKTVGAFVKDFNAAFLEGRPCTQRCSQRTPRPRWLRPPRPPTRLTDQV